MDLAAAEIELRLKVGEPARVEHYVRFFPELAGDGLVVTEWIVAECLGRNLLGENEKWIDEYQSRFPDHASLIIPNLLKDCLPRRKPKSDILFHQTPKQLGRYLVQEEIGRGSYGVVYRGVDPQTHQEVAIKVLYNLEHAAEQEVRRLFREARYTASLRHPGIVPVIAAEMDETNKIAYVVFKLCRGLSLEKQLKLGRKFTPEQAVRLVIQVAESLHASHENDITHRDLKPANILQDESGLPLVSDFGLAVRENGTQTASVGDDGGFNLIGTIAYMSPEQVKGEATDKPAVDIHAAGVLLYELLTGQRPFQGSPTMIMAAIKHLTPISPSALDRNIPEPISRVCLKALAKSPEDRQATALQFADELKAALKGIAPKQKTAPPAKRQSAVRLCVLLLVLALVEAFGLFYTFWGWSNAEKSSRTGSLFSRTSMVIDDQVSSK